MPVGLAALLIGAKVLPESAQPASARLDLPGAALLAGSLLLVLLPVVQGQAWGWPGWGWALFAAGLAGLGMLLALERRLSARGGHPVLDPQLLTNRGFSGGLLASLAFFGGIASFFLLLSMYLQDGTGRTALTTGLITLPYALGSMVTSGVGVKLVARHGRRLLITGSLVIAASHAAMWLVVTRIDQPAWWQLGGPLLLGGLGPGLAAPPLINVVLAAVPGRQAGSAGGVLSTVNQIGGAAGVAALGTLFFTQLARADGAGPGVAYADAFAAVLPLQVGLYLVAAALMTTLPAATAVRTR